jgi:hypothetical protein
VTTRNNGDLTVRSARAVGTPARTESDEYTDNNAVTLGIHLWNNYQQDMTKTQFQHDLERKIGGLSKCNYPLQEVDSGFSSNWPYENGHFNGRGNVYKYVQGSCQ